MSDKHQPKATFPGAAGVKAEVQQKSRARRRAEKTLVEAEASIGRAARNDLLPNIKIEFVPIDSLRPARRRVRRSNPEQVARVATSIAAHGVCNPVLVDGERRIVHGHLIWEAARQLRLQTIPTISLDHLSESERRTLAIALNRTAETGAWDTDALVLEFQELIDLNQDVLATGFELVEIDALLIEETTDQQPEERLPELPSSPVSRPGDVWRCGDHLVVQGDARDPVAYERLFREGRLARLVLTDVPFNVPIKGHCSTQEHHREFVLAHGEMSRDEFAQFNTDWMQTALQHVVDGGLLATFIDWRSVEIILAVGRHLGLDLLNIIVWSKSNAGQGSLWRSQHELLPVFRKGQASHVNNVELGRWGRYRSNVWTYAGASTVGSEAREALAVHPTVKPRTMLADALLDVTNRGEIVLDCFLGSGSMLLAAEETGRLCRSIEIDAAYCDVAIERWQTATGQLAVLEQTEETFLQVATRRALENGRQECRS